MTENQPVQQFTITKKAEDRMFNCEASIERYEDSKATFRNFGNATTVSDNTKGQNTSYASNQHC